MKDFNIQLPSNRKFGSFFTAIFLMVAIYFFWTNSTNLSLVFALVGSTFALITTFRAQLLKPLNKLWMRFGFLIGSIVSPIVLGLIFFLMFTPIALFMKIIGRDELRLKMNNSSTYWKTRPEVDSDADAFKYQF